MFRDDSLTFESLDRSRLYWDSTTNLEFTILPLNIGENFKIGYNRSI